MPVEAPRPGQSENKESRIITNAPAVNQNIIFPEDWEKRWPVFAKDLKNFRADFKANKHDDGPDCLTLIIERFLSTPQNPFKHSKKLPI